MSDSKAVAPPDTPSQGPSKVETDAVLRSVLRGEASARGPAQ